MTAKAAVRFSLVLVRALVKDKFVLQKRIKSCIIWVISYDFLTFVAEHNPLRHCTTDSSICISVNIAARKGHHCLQAAHVLAFQVKIRMDIQIHRDAYIGVSQNFT